MEESFGIWRKGKLFSAQSEVLQSPVDSQTIPMLSLATSVSLYWSVCSQVISSMSFAAAAASLYSIPRLDNQQQTTQNVTLLFDPVLTLASYALLVSVASI